MKVAPSDSNIILTITPKDNVPSALYITLSIQMKGHFQDAQLSICLLGVEKYEGQDKKVKYVFYRRSIEDRTITICSDKMTEYNYLHCFGESILPSTFAYSNPFESITASIQYKLKVKITNRSEKLLFKKSIHIPYHTKITHTPTTSFTHTLFQNTITFNIKLNNSLYKSNERILSKCHITKPVWDIYTNLTKLKICCKLRQTIILKERIWYLFNSYIKHDNDLVKVEHSINNIPDYLDQSVWEFPIWIDLRAINMANVLGSTASSSYLENKYNLVFDVRMEDNRMLKEEFSIPLLIKAL